ncbi:MAG: tyrosine-type recombinase/integrase, partial [Candidatus Bathyarchaeota archaeon]|nr:tyrosine-type recombinase/integrase [Candidatus Bathyarchaeota archaeon]
RKNTRFLIEYIYNLWRNLLGRIESARFSSCQISCSFDARAPRILSISKELVARFEMLPKVSERLFSSSMKVMYNNFNLQRKRTAKKFNNTRLLKRTFTTLRHWKDTSYYHEVRDILKVKQLLGHKTLRSTMVYIDIEKAIYGELNQEFNVKVAETQKEIETLLEVGFKYVCEKDGKLFFRKRK